MKAIGILMISAFIFAASVFGGPNIKATASISIRDSQFVVVRVLRDRTEIDALLSCFRRAKEIGSSSARRTFSHKIDVGDRWLYDVTRGELMLLSMAEHSLFKLSDSDRRFVARLIDGKRPNQPPEPTAMSVTISACAELAPATTVAHL